MKNQYFVPNGTLDAWSKANENKTQQNTKKKLKSKWKDVKLFSIAFRAIFLCCFFTIPIASLCACIENNNLITQTLQMTPIYYIV